MWRQDDLVNVLGGGGNVLVGLGPAADMEEIQPEGGRRSGRLTTLPACPLMHGTGLFSAFPALNLGGCVVTVPEARFDPAHLWQTVVDQQVHTHGHRRRRLRPPASRRTGRLPGPVRPVPAHPHQLIRGQRGARRSKTDCSATCPTSSFRRASACRRRSAWARARCPAGEHWPGRRGSLRADGAWVVGPDDVDIVAGSGDVGVIALPGFLPVGYYKDEEKTERTFKVFEGRRWSVPGDWAMVEADGSLRAARPRLAGDQHRRGEGLPGRRSRRRSSATRASGHRRGGRRPDPRFGERICAVVDTGDAAALASKTWPGTCARRWRATRLRANWSSPRYRAANGKLDFEAVARRGAEGARVQAWGRSSGCGAPQALLLTTEITETRSPRRAPAPP